MPITSYLAAADVHNYANGQGSLEDESTWISDASKFTMSAIVRGVTSTFNTIPGTINFFGGNVDYLETEEVLNFFDNDLGNYYLANKDTVDKVGDIVGSMVPGIAAVKVLNYGQRALATLNKGNAGVNMARSIGLLSTKADEYAKIAATRIAANPYTKINSDVIKSFAAGYGQSALEGAAFLTAASVTMKEYSPLFQDQTAKDIIINSLYGGGLVGAGIFGTITAAQTYTGVKRAIKAASIESKPATVITETVGGSPAFLSMMMRISDKNTLAKALANKEIKEEFLQKATKKADNLDIALRSDINKLQIGQTDPEFGTEFFHAIKGIDNDTSLAVLPGLQEVGRYSTALPLEKEVSDYVSLGMPGAPGSIKYTTLWGEGRGEITHTAPEVIHLADMLPNAKEVMNTVKSHNFKAPLKTQVTWWDSLDSPSHFESEARMIWAKELNYTKEEWESIILGANDIPVLQEALFSGAEKFRIAYDKAGDTVYSLTKSELYDHLVAIKDHVARTLLMGPAKPNTATIAKIADVKKSYLEGVKGNQLEDMFVSYRYSAQDLTRPRIAKLGYKMPKAYQDIDPKSFIEAATYIKQTQIIQQQAVDNVFANYMDGYLTGKNSLFEPLDDSLIYRTTEEDAGAGFATAASGGYGTAGSIAENIGKSSHAALEETTIKGSETFAGVATAVKNDPKAAAEILTLQKLIRTNPAIFEYDEITGSLINTVADKTDNVAMTLTTPAAKEFLATWMDHNSTYLTHRRNMLSAGAGLETKDMSRIVFFPGPNPKKFTHHAFVVDNSVTGTGQVSMIWAKSAEELSAKAARVPSEFKIYYEKDTANYFKAFQSYNYQLGINENYINSALHRRGVAAELDVNYDIEEVMQELLNYRAHADRGLVRDMVAMKYSKYFKELYHLGDEYTAIGTSKATGFALRKHAEEQVKNPYVDIVKTALDITKDADIPLWTAFNNFAENSFAKVYNGVSSIWKGAGTESEKLAAVRAHLEEAGVSTAYKDAAYSIYQSHAAGRGPLTQFVNSANSVLTTLLLRTDPMNAVNNGIGHNVLLWSETKYILNGIKNKSDEAAGELAKLAEINVPGGIGTIISPSKLISTAYSNYFKALRDDPSVKGLLQYYKDNRYINTLFDQYKDALEFVSLTGKETASELASRTSKLVALAEKFSGNSFAEEMNRFVAANVAHQITDLAIKHGVLTPAKAMSYINTFVNRTQGNYLASQRPMLFQGPLGKSIGLFQTYQFNMLQHIFRHMGEGNTKQLGFLMGLQGTIYGMNGLPAFNAINQYIVGNAEGNRSHSDIISTTFDAAGHEGGQWLLYGLSSNFLLHPDLKTNLYTRGDINPRQVTIVPVNPADVPIVGAIRNVYSSLKETGSKIIKGADVSEAFLQGIEHAQISRPLAGLAVVAQGHSTTSKGNIMAYNDLYSLSTFARVLGARPLDEAIARDAYYRVQVYEGEMQTKLKVLGESIRNKITSEEPVSQEEIESFLASYVRAGGDQKNFMKYWQYQVKQANTNQIKQLMSHTSSPFSVYMQKIMGGTETPELFE